MKPWTTVEAKYLKDHYARGNLRDIAAHLGRSYRAVVSYAHHAGISAPRTIRYRAMHDVPALIAKGLNVRKLARAVGCSPRTMWKRVKADYPECYDALKANAVIGPPPLVKWKRMYLRDNRGRMTVQELAAAVGAHERTVRRHLAAEETK